MRKSVQSVFRAAFGSKQRVLLDAVAAASQQRVSDTASVGGSKHIPSAFRGAAAGKDPQLAVRLTNLSARVVKAKQVGIKPGQHHSKRILDYTQFRSKLLIGVSLGLGSGATKPSRWGLSSDAKG